MWTWFWSMSGAHVEDNPVVFHLNGLDRMRQGVMGRSERMREREREKGRRCAGRGCDHIHTLGNIVMESCWVALVREKVYICFQLLR